MVCVKSGEGRLRDLERVWMCLVLGEVRKGRMDLCCAGSAIRPYEDYLQH